MPSLGLPQRTPAISPDRTGPGPSAAGPSPRPRSGPRGRRHVGPSDLLLLLAVAIVGLMVSPAAAILGASPTSGTGSATSVLLGPSLAAPGPSPTVTLYPAAGTVGSWVAAQGTLFSASTTISFTVGGASVASTCSSDGTGTFPGVSGTACTFRVPSAAAGSVSVIASDGTHTATTPFQIESSIALSPVSGSVGHVVGVSGSGFALSSAVSFTLGGTPVVTACSTDASGNFPGTSGTSCSFTVPVVGLGAYLFAATAGATTASTAFSVLGLSLSPSSGAVGTSVGAAGEGFPASANVSLAVGGTPVASTCSTDSSGNFPGITGTPCSFTVPTVPLGAQNVTAVGWSTDATVNLATVPDTGAGAYVMAYDSAKSEVFVLNANVGSVSVLSTTTNALVATIGVGSSPHAIVYDSGRSELFVANEGSGNVSVISDATNKVVATVTVGTNPWSLAYDSGKGEIFVANHGSSSVSVISDSTNTVVATVTAGRFPYYAVYDPGASAVYVANEGSANVTVISDVTNAFHATVAVGTDPYYLVYDSGKNYVYSINEGGRTVSAISDSTNTVVATIPVGQLSMSGVYDSGKSEIFVTNYNNANVSVISDSTNKVIATVKVGTNPLAVAYDAGTGEVYVANENSANVSIISDATNTILGSAAVGRFPEGVVYASGANAIYVSAEVAGTVTAIADATRTVTATIASVPVPAGFYQEALAYDAGRGEIFAASMALSTVSVINDTRNTIQASIAVGSGPYALAYDAGRGEVFVANEDSNNISVISDSTNTVVATIALSAPAGGEPAGIAYDSARNEIFVANEATNNVSVIADSTNTIVANITVGSEPEGVAYDGPANEIFVADSGNDNVSVLSDKTDAVVATITVGSSPGALAYDSALREVFVANYESGSVSAISDVTNQVVATLTVGTEPDGVAYDPTSEEVLVANYLSSSVSVVAPSGASLLAALPLQSGVWGLAYDAGHGSLYAANYYVLELSVGTYFGVTPFSVRSSLVPTLSPTSGVAGSIVKASGTGYLESVAIAISFGMHALTTSCATDGTGTFPGTSGTACTFVVPSVATGAYTVSVTDGTHVGNATFFVSALALSKPNGTVGSTLHVSGTGPAASAGVALSLPGTALASGCATDASGDFPGTSGSNCSFAVPAIPGGAENVSATGWTITGTNVGDAPQGVAYDSGRSEIFVTNYGSGSVSVISDATGAVLAQVTVGTNPIAAAYDAGRGEVFVANYHTGTVSVISDATNTVVATITVENNPTALAYDPVRGEVFVTNWGSDTVSVISDTTNTVVATIPVGTEPESIAYDPNLGEMFVGNDYTDNLTVIDDAARITVASVPVGQGPLGIAYDAALGEMFVANRRSDNVSVVFDAALKVVATIGVGSVPSAVAYDSALATVWIANAGSANVSEIADASNVVLGSVAVGSAPAGLAFDSGTAQLFVANSGAQNVSVVSARAYASAPFTVLASLAARGASSSSVDVGQVLWVTGLGFGRTAAMASFTLGGSSITCLAASVGRCSGGTITSAQNGSFYGELEVPSVPAAGVYTLSARDVAGNSATAPVQVYLVPSAGTVSASPSSVDVHQTARIGTTAANGTGHYTYLWTGLPASCSGTGGSFDCAPSAPGNYSIQVEVTDSNGVSVTSPAFVLVVYALPIAATPTPSVPSGGVDAGQSVTLRTSATAGTGTYTGFGWTGLPGGCSGSSATVTCAGATDLPSGTYRISATATDSNGGVSLPSANLTFVVLADPTVTTPAPNTTSIDVGQSVTFTTVASLGTGSYAFAWNGLPTGCRTASTDALVCAPTGSGTFEVSVSVTDTNNFTAPSGTLSFLVYAAPTVTLQASARAVDVGGTLVFSARAALGSGGYAYVWSGLPTGCSGSDHSLANLTCSPTAANNFTTKVTVTDSNGFAVTSTGVTVAVAPALSATLTPSTTTPTTGENVTFTVARTGGTGPWYYNWSFGDGTKGEGAVVHHTFGTSGTFTVTVWVNDSASSSVVRTATLSVSAPSSTSAWYTSTWVLAAAGGAAAIVVVVAAVVLVRRSHGSPPSDR